MRQPNACSRGRALASEQCLTVTSRMETRLPAQQTSLPPCHCCNVIATMSLPPCCCLPLCHCRYLIAAMSLPPCHCRYVIATMALPLMCVLEGPGLACIKHHVPNILSIELRLHQHVATACVPGWNIGRKLRVEFSILGCQRRLWHDRVG